MTDYTLKYKRYKSYYLKQKKELQKLLKTQTGGLFDKDQIKIIEQDLETLDKHITILEKLIENFKKKIKTNQEQKNMNMKKYLQMLKLKNPRATFDIEQKKKFSTFKKEGIFYNPEIDQLHKVLEKLDLKFDDKKLHETSFSDSDEFKKIKQESINKQKERASLYKQYISLITEKRSLYETLLFENQILKSLIISLENHNRHNSRDRRNYGK